jgi:hypothetical protein
MAHITSTTSPDATSVLTTWLNKNFVTDLEFQLQHQKFTTKAIIPKGAGNKGRFLTFGAPTKYTSYSGAGQTSFTEGSTTANEITAITQTSTDITIAEFGEFTKVGTLYEYASVPGLRQELLKRLRDGAAFSLDRAVLLKALTTTSILYADTTPAGASTSTTTAMTAVLGASSITAATKTLFNNLAQGFRGVEGVPDGQYGAVITPDQEQDLVTEYTTLRMSWSNSVVQVPGPMGQEKWVNGYLGSIYRTAVVVTQNYTTMLITTSQEVAIIYSDGGVGSMAFADMNAEIVLNDVNSPYKNVNSFAWHAMFGAGLIDSNRVIKLYSAT